jgi:hypothetical protein
MEHPTGYHAEDTLPWTIPRVVTVNQAGVWGLGCTDVWGRLLLWAAFLIY